MLYTENNSIRTTIHNAPISMESAERLGVVDVSLYLRGDEKHPIQRVKRDLKIESGRFDTLSECKT